MKLADLLKSMSLPNTPAYRAGEMLLECERDLARIADVFLDVDGKHGPQESEALDAARATLAKLRGEA